MSLVNVTLLWESLDQARLLIYRGSYMSNHGLLNLIKRVEEKRLNARLSEHFTSSIHSIIQEHEC